MNEPRTPKFKGMDNDLLNLKHQRTALTPRQLDELLDATQQARDICRQLWRDSGNNIPVQKVYALNLDEDTPLHRQGLPMVSTP